MNDHTRRDSPRAPRVLCSAVDFGFGPAGKLLSILPLLADFEITIVGSQLLAQISSRAPSAAWRSVALGADLDQRINEGEFDVALVVLDPELATKLTSRGLRVVYVDSLPHIWSEGDPVCEDVFSYCAQKTGHAEARVPSALRRVENLHWIEPIACGAGPRRRDPTLAVVNLGGVHSPHLGNGSSPYVRAVVPGAVDALIAANYRVCVTGPVDGDIRERLGGQGVSCTVVEHADFLGLLAEAGLLLTSPGMTTMLEAGKAGTPTVLLPPQNLSQILNADQVAGSAHAHRIDWPAVWLDRDAINRVRWRGEQAALELVYAGTSKIAERQETASWLANEVSSRLPGEAEWLRDRVRQWGADGAEQVAARLREGVAANRRSLRQESNLRISR